jgi:hypothetical protein
MASQDTRFKPGQSGNPGGRPKSRPFRDALMAEVRAGDGGSDALADIARQLVARALSGDHQSIGLLVDRLEGRPVASPSLDLQTPLSQLNPADALGAIADAVATGQISPQEGQQMASLIESRIKAIEMVDLERRLSELEAAKGR